MTTREMRGLLLMAMALLIALAWFFRYKPLGERPFVWDRVLHRYCVAHIGEPMECSR